MARPSLNPGDPVTEPVAIEKLSYRGPAFRLEDGQAHEIYSLVDTGNAPVTRCNHLRIRDTHGTERHVPWGTLMYPIR